MAVLETDCDMRAERPRAVVEIDSWCINTPDQGTLIERILDDVGHRRGGTVFTINLDHLSKLGHDPEFGAAYRAARHVTADGFPVVLLARAKGIDIKRVTGADLVQPLVRAAARIGIPVYFFGTSEEILAKATERLRAIAPDLVVAGSEAPPMGFDAASTDAEEAARRIAASGAGLCFVALGAPKQEIFSHVAGQIATEVTFLSVGAALDFIAGRRSRAPRILQAIGMEWVWRAAQEPLRLVPRYAENALWLARYVLREVLFARALAPSDSAEKN